MKLVIHLYIETLLRHIISDDENSYLYFYFDYEKISESKKLIKLIKEYSETKKDFKFLSSSKINESKNIENLKVAKSKINTSDFLITNNAFFEDNIFYVNVKHLTKTNETTKSNKKRKKQLKKIFLKNWKLS